VPFRLLADLVLVAHLGFIAFTLLGAVCALRWTCAPVAHLPALAWAAYIELSAGICPLTPLENALRRAGGGAGYSSSFVEHYLVPLIYPSGLTARVQIGLAAGLLALNGLLYAYVLARRGTLRALRHPSRRRT